MSTLRAWWLARRLAGHPPAPGNVCFSVVMAVAVSGACQTGRMVQGTVVMPADLPVEDQLALARRVATAVWGDGALRSAITARFPSVRPDDLSGMFLHWARVRLDDAGREGAVIQIGVREVGDRVPAAEVVEFVAARCREELTTARGMAR